MQGHQNVGELRLVIRIHSCKQAWLQGHQNVGELRPSRRNGSDLHFNCRVTRMLVSYDRWRKSLKSISSDCRVTRMLVSYDFAKNMKSSLVWLQGHQNVGELRHIDSRYHVQVEPLQGHQNVGELRQPIGYVYPMVLIAGSPECWWVTTSKIVCSSSGPDCRVTRMLVSYDVQKEALRLHAFIAGSPECWWVTT